MDITMEVSDWMSVTSALAVGAVSLLTYCIWKSLKKFKTFQKMGIPGPDPSFLVGNARQMTKMGMCEVFVEWNKKYGKCYGIYILREPSLVISDLDLLRDLFVKQFADFPNRMPQEMFSNKPWSENLSVLRDDHWKHVRNQLSPTFSSGKLKKMMPAIDRVLQNLSRYINEKVKTSEEVELKYVAGCFAMDTIAGAAFGMQVDSLSNPDDPFSVNGHKLLKFNKWILPILFRFPSLARVLQRFGLTYVPTKPTNFFLGIMDTALQHRRTDKQSHSDFLQLMMDAEKEESAQGPVDAEIDHSAQLTTSGQWERKGLNNDELRANALIFFLAGYDTTSVALSFTLFHLAANPEALKKAHEEIDKKLGKNPVSYNTAMDLTYLDMCLNEALRLNPPGFLLDRQAQEDVEFGGYQIKKGTRMMVPVYAIHRDPEIWPEPEKYRPERHTPEAKAARHPFAFMPFGHGPRNCIGMRLAQLQIRMALATVLQNYTPVLCDKSVYPPVIPPPQTRIISRDGLWVRFKLREELFVGLTDDELRANAFIFFVAGYDTTATALSFTLFHLAANPEALKKAQEEIDQKVGKVKKGTRMIIPAYAIHRDPEIWPEPEKYQPERHTPEAKVARHPFAFMPFGHGPRNCIGMRLAQLQIRMAIAAVLQNYTPVLCDKSVYPPVLEPPQSRMMAKDGLWVKFKIRD